MRKQEATLFHLRWLNANTEVDEAERRAIFGMREVAAATLAQTEAAKKQETVAAALPPLREDEARAGAALQRLVIARETLDREEERAPGSGIAELEPPAGATQRRHCAREAARDRFRMGSLERLATEADALRRDLEAGRKPPRDGGQRVAKPTPCWPASEKIFGELHRRARRSHRAAQPARKRRRASRPNGCREIRARDRARSRRNLRKIDADSPRCPDLAALKSAVEAAQDAVTEAEAAAVRAEAAHSAARQALDVARRPLAEAERRANRLETEAKTLRKVAACRCRAICGRRSSTT